MSPLKVGSMVAGFCIAAVIALIAFSPSSSTATSDSQNSDLIGNTSPEFEATSLDGEAVSVSFDVNSTNEDEWVVLNFFALWCIECKKEHPALEQFNDVLADSGKGRMISVVFGNENLEQVEKFFVSQNKNSDGLPWPVIDKPRLSFDLGVNKIPETVVINSQGTIVYHVKGEAECGKLAGAIGLDVAECGGL